MSYNVQNMGDLEIERSLSTSFYPNVALNSNIAPLPSGFYVQMLGGGSGGLTSNVKIKRPDGTWATVFQVDGIHVYYGGAWHVL